MKFHVKARGEGVSSRSPSALIFLFPIRVYQRSSAVKFLRPLCICPTRKIRAIRAIRG